jgi:hypothetical protein
MKSILKTSSLLIAMFFAFILMGALAAFAQSASPSPTPIPPGDLVSSGLSVAQAFKIGGIWVGISGLINLLVNVLKTNTLGGFFDKILPSKWQSAFVLGLSLISVVIGSVVSGGTLSAGLVLGIQSAAGASFAHELIKDIFGDPKPVVSVAPSANQPPAAS